MLERLTLLAIAGAMGTLARYGLSGLAHRLVAGDFPIGTLAVNALGSFLFGLVWPMAEERLLISAQTRIVLLTGFMGAFTTFSTFSHETGMMLDDGQWWRAGVNVAGNVLLGVGCWLAGAAIGHRL